MLVVLDPGRSQVQEEQLTMNQFMLRNRTTGGSLAPMQSFVQQQGRTEQQPEQAFGALRSDPCQAVAAQQSKVMATATRWCGPFRP